MSSSKLTLAIETSNPSSGSSTDPSAGVALARTNSDSDLDIMGVEWLLETGRHDDDLMPAIDRLCSSRDIQPHQIDRLAVSVGPGGYTGLRVAVTTASAIAACIGAELVEVPTAYALRERVSGSGPCAVCLAFKGRSAWIHRFPEDTAGVAPVESLLGQDLQRVVADRFLPQDIRESLLALGIRVESPVFDPTAVARVSTMRPPVAVARALYAREPEAVTRWRDLHSRS